MIRPRIATVFCWLLFSLVLLASAAIREGPTSALNQAVIWLPTGVSIAGLWLLGLDAWWVVALTTLVQRFVLGYEISVTLPAALGSTAEAVLGVLVLRHLGLRASFGRLRDVAALFAAAAIAPLGSIAFSWLGRSFFWADRNMPFYSGWDGWWRMNALGVLTVVPAALAWLTLARSEVSPRRTVGVLAAAIALAGFAYATLLLVPPGIVGVMWLNAVVAPVVLFAAGRFGIRGATLASIVPALVVANGSAHGFGPFLELPRELRHVALQLFELTFVAIPPTFGALIAERRTAEDRGTRSDEMRRSMQSALPDITYVIGRDGTFLEVSVPPGIEPPLPVAELPGRSIHDLFPAELCALFERTTRTAVATGRPETMEYALVAGGRARVREARCVPYGDSETLVVVRDITDRKWAEGTTAFEARVLALVATGRPPSEVFAELVEGMEQLMPGGRCSVITLDGRRMHVAMAPSLPAAYNAAVEGVEIGPDVGSCGAAAHLGENVVVREIATDRRWAPYLDLVLPHGLRACWSVPIRDPLGRVLGTFAIYHDEPCEPEPRELALAERAGTLAGIVLEREQRIGDLRRTEDLLTSINRNVKEGLFRASADHLLLYANPALARLFGYDSPEQMVAASPGDMIVDERRRDELLRTVFEQGQWLNEELRLRRRDGTIFWGLLSGAAVHDEAGEVAYFDGALADISARKELEEQFRQSQKMEAVGKLAGGVAHDFNNLLTVIFGYADAVRSEAGERDEIREHADQILDAAGRASRLTRQLLAYSRQQVLLPRVLDLNAVVDQMGGMLHRLIGEDVRLVVVHRSGSCWVRVDPSQIEQVLLNLVVNARDAMPEGGTLTIATAVAADGEARVHADLAPGPCALLSVSDTGVGMTPDVQARAFDPFFTTKGPGRGTGLGLSTVYGIVRQSGGAVWLESTPGPGTTVWIGLPIWASPAEPEEVPPADAGGALECTVLVVEDEPGVRALVSRTLRQEGCTVLEAGDGAAGLEVAGAHPGRIDLVVTDLVMPRMGGRDMAARLLAARPGTPFLFISGYPDDGRAPQDLIGSGGGFLAKPFTPEALLRSVRALLRHGTVRG